ncbi:MAG: hypothetical protein WCT77_12680 [Bacteroidota bacterium]|jgi:hypothetical protein
MAKNIKKDEMNLDGLDEMIHQAIKDLIVKKIKEGLIDVDMLKNGSVQDVENNENAEKSNSNK